MRVVLLYVLLVGLPVAGLLGLLHAGQRLEAPPAFGGTWRVEVGGACGLRPGDTIEVVQSGRYLAMELPRRRPLDVRLDGGVLRGRGAPRATSTPGCAGGPLDLRLRGDGARPERLRGVAGVSGCAECPPRPVEAVRLPPGRVVPSS